MTCNRLILIVLLNSLFGSCTGLNRGLQHGAELDRVQGIWEICLKPREVLNRAQRSGFSAGYISLTPLEEPTQLWMYLGQPTHYGVYTNDVAQIGIARDPRIPIPLVGARVVSDSVYLVLDPFGSHGPLVVRGQLGRDTASGIWFHQAYAFGAEGTFSMRHVGSRTLPVPYPVGGPATSPATAGCVPSEDGG
jgi:hypothetical protein